MPATLLPNHCDFITSVSQVRAGDDRDSGEAMNLWEMSAGPCSGANRAQGQAFSFSEEVSQLTHHLAASETPQKCMGGPVSCLCHVPAVCPSHPVLAREDELSARHGADRWGTGGLERNLMQEKRMLCHPPLTGLPSPGQSPVNQASVPNIPKATAPGAGTGHGMGQDVCVPPVSHPGLLLWAVTSPVTVPLLPRPLLQPPHSMVVPRLQR